MTDKKKEWMRTLKFTLFSISAGVIQILVETLCLEAFSLAAWLAYTIALVCSVVWNFTFNRKFTFHSAANVPVAMLKALAFYVPFAPLSIWWTKVLTESYGWNEYLVLAITMIINFVTEYLYQRFFVFGKSMDTAKEK